MTSTAELSSPSSANTLLTHGVVDTDYTLDHKYSRESGRIYLSGVQALVRLPLMQRLRDQAAGLNTAGFISGYRGSPLGGFDLELWRAKKYLEAAQWRAAVTTDETSGIQSRGLVAQALHQRQPDQRLDPAQVDAAVGSGVLVLKGIIVVQHADLRGVGGRGGGEFGSAGHGWPGGVRRLATSGKCPTRGCEIVSAGHFVIPSTRYLCAAAVRMGLGR